MESRCFLCDLSSNNHSIIIKHLRIIHNVRESIQTINCIASVKCAKSFLTFKGIQKHLEKCKPEVPSQMVAEIRVSQTEDELESAVQKLSRINISDESIDCSLEVYPYSPMLWV